MTAVPRLLRFYIASWVFVAGLIIGAAVGVTFFDITVRAYLLTRGFHL